MMYDIPQDLKDYIDEQIEEGNDVICTGGIDCISWIVEYENINWITLLQWYPGSSKWAHINLNGPFAKRLRRSLEDFPQLDEEPK